jgi:hypothetical protein
VDDEDVLKLVYDRPKRGCKGTLTVLIPGGDSVTDKIELADAAQRVRFVNKLCQGREVIDKAAAMAELERLAGEETAKSVEDGGGRRSQADVLLALAEGAELFHAPGNGDSEAFAALAINGHKETWPVRSKGFRHWLARLCHKETGRAPRAQALEEALSVLSGRALYDGLERPVALRVAEHQGVIYLDLADPDWRAVEITSEGWRVVADPPVRFVRRRGMLALPAPDRGGSVEELRPLVNLPDEDAWTLFLAWLVAALRPGRPFPILAVNGEQGSAKTTLCRVARALIDPNFTPLRRPPRNEHDLMIAARNGWIVALDNLSGIPPNMSDALCTLATGGGFGTRELYSDDEEKLFDAMRPILLNGIEDVATRPDLLDRAICMSLPMISDGERRDEAALWKEFERVRPRVSGALLDAVVMALRKLPSMSLATKPRMADFALLATAAEPALPVEPGAFLAAYAGNRGAANQLALDASIIGGPLLSLMTGCGFWEGTAQDLLDALEANPGADKVKKNKNWPSGPRMLGGELRRLVPNLRRVGWAVDFTRDPGGQRRRIIRLHRTLDRSSPPSRPSRTAGIAEEKPGQLRDGIPPEAASDHPDEGPADPAVRDGSDDRDGVLRRDPFCTGDPEEEVEWTG